MENKNIINRKGLKNLLILDGDPHSEYHKIEEDEIRDKHLWSLGFTLLRFENRVVFEEPEYLRGEIRKVLSKEIEST
jgi:very-short-patch-repair endonuclease